MREKIINPLKRKSNKDDDSKLVSALRKKQAMKKKTAKKPMKKGTKKFDKVMKEFGSGKLRSGSKKGPKVKKLSQARAIAYSEDRKADKTAKGMKNARGMPKRKK